MKDFSNSQLSEKTAVLLLSGFLGAGKTTLLKRILSWEADLSRTVVLVNEFGDIGIDGSLLEDSGSDVVELTSGCICCTLSADLKQSLTRILRDFKPLRILIESSGVADPTAVAEVIQKTDLSEKLVLSKIITVLDADFWEAREMFGPLFYHQLEMAHLLLLNKVDLLEKNKISMFLDEIHKLLPNARVLPTIHCHIDPDTLWMNSQPSMVGLKSMDFFRPAPANQRQRPQNKMSSHAHSEKEHPHNSKFVDASGYVTFSYETSDVMDEKKFIKFVEDLPLQVFRMKGPVRFQDRTVVVNFVGGKCQWSDWRGKPDTRLAFIGWDVRSEETLNKLKACLIK